MSIIIGSPVLRCRLINHDARCVSSKGGYLDALSLRVEILIAESGEVTLAGLGWGSEGPLLHSVIVKGADGVNVWAGSKLLELFLGVVEIEDLLDAVEVLADVVFVNADTQCLVDLPLHLMS